MYERNIIYLIDQSPDPHGITVAPTETLHMVYATIKSVGHTEVYQALTHGLHPSITFHLANYLDYGGELYIQFEGKRYRVIRTYRTGMAIELTVEEVADV